MNICYKCERENLKYAKKCECDYKEINMFFNCIWSELDKQFKVYDCPDKHDNAAFTCDMILEEINTSEKIYVEVKTVLYGYDNPEDGKEQTAKMKDGLRNRQIAQEKGQKLCVQWVSEVTDRCDMDKMDSLWMFMVTVPQLQIGVEEKEEFCRQLQVFLDETSFEEDEYCFVYKRERNGEEIKIPFTKKDDELCDWFNEGIAFQCDISGDGSMPAVFGRMTDTEKLRELLKKNAKKTSEKNKFPDTEERKILLNILQLPQGLDTFFDVNMENYIIGALMERQEDYKSTADENYLLYHSPEYRKPIIREDGTYELEKERDVLFIIPLIGGLLKEASIYLNE